MPVILILAALPLIEIALFVAIGAQIGVLGVLAQIVLSAFAGVSILRGQQARAVDLMRGGMRVSAGRMLAQGAFRLVAGLLLIVPGFLTDVLGLLLLIPLVQRALVAALALRVVTAQTWPREDVVEGEFTVADPPDTPPRPTLPRGH